MRKHGQGSLRKRGNVWFIRYPVDGKQVEESAETPNKSLAQDLLTQRLREIAAGTWRAPGERAALARVEAARLELERAYAAAPEAKPITVGDYLDGWMKRREASGVRGARNERRYFEHYVKPVIGKLALAVVTRTHIRDLVATLNTTKSERTGELLAPRTVLHVYRTLTMAFGDAVLDRVITESPCTLKTKRGELPKKRDKDPTWRSKAVYTREEAIALLSSPEIPDDRRVLYGLQLLAGLRGGESVGRRWRDYDATVAPLGRLLVATQAEGAKGDRETKTTDVREVPVHPTLAAILDDWRRVGFPLFFMREAQPDDPITPSRNDPTGRSFRSKTGAYDSLIDDLKVARLRRVPHARHAQRATFLTLLETDGAIMRIAARATHRAPTDVVGGYVRTGWAELCREIAKLDLTLPARPIPPPNKGSFKGSSAAAIESSLETGAEKWALQDLNLRLQPCEGCTLPLS